jgi:hypothetical protein
MLARQLFTRTALRSSARAFATTLDGATLYDAAAPNCRRVRMFLAEKGVTVNTQQVNIGKAEVRDSSGARSTGKDGSSSYPALLTAWFPSIHPSEPHPRVHRQDRHRPGPGAGASKRRVPQ